MDEFFSPATTNSRKAEIEKLLGSFSEQSTAWKDCLYFLTSTSNQYVCMFSLTTLETFIHQRWVGMFGADRAEIRTTLNSFLSQHHTTAPQFIRNKLVKLIVDIARSDWPHFYPEFFSQITSLLSGGGSSSSTELGLTLLLTASEELGTPRQDISTNRAVELHKLMLAQLPSVSSCLVRLLEAGLGREANTPSSPSDSEDSDSMDAPQPPPTVSLPLSAASRDAAVLCLRVVAHLLSWAPPSHCVSSRLIRTLFLYAALEVRAQVCSTVCSPTNNYNFLCSQGKDDACTELSVLAMNAINEIIYKNYVPVDFADYVVIMFRSCHQLLESLLSEPNKCRDLDQLYLEKITDCLRLFVSLHIGRCQQNQQFPLLEFLALIFKFTFDQRSVTGFRSCLEIWASLVDFIQGSMETRADSGEEVLKKYEEALLSLVVEILKKSQFRLNGAALSELDSKTVTEDGNTELRQFHMEVTEIVMKISELLPEQVLAIINAGWRETSQVYLEMDKLVVEREGTKYLSVVNDQELSKLVAELQDLSSFLLIVGRLGTMFLGHHFLPRLKLGLEYVKQLLVIVTFGSKQKLWKVNLSFNSKFEVGGSFIECQAETIAALKAWCHWLAALHSESLQDSSYTWPCTDITSNIVKQVVTVIKDTSTPALTHSGAHFLVTLTGTVRPPSIWKLKDFTDLYSMISQLELENEAHRLLVRSLTNVLLLPWPGTQEQKWDDRRKHLAKFLRDLTESFRNLKTQMNFVNDRRLQQQAEPCIILTLQLIGDLVDNVLNEVTQTKKLCHDVTRDYIEITLWLFPVYVNNNKVCEEMFQFFYTVFDVLKTQMGANFVEQTVQTFFSMFGNAHLTEVLMQKKGPTETKVVEKFLSILTFIVSEPGTTFRKFVSSTLSLCLETILPIIMDQPYTDLKAPVFNLLYHTLLHNWNFFFKSNLKAFHNNNGDSKDNVENKEAFLGVMKVFGHSFCQTDITIFRQNVFALEQLNAKWRLYSKPIFKETLLADFLSVYLRALIAKSHHLLKEEIGTAVYNLASTDFPVFFQKFIPQFLSSVSVLDDNQRQILAETFAPDNDLPSFLNNLDRLVTDLRYYQLVNLSLPQGTVKF